MEEMLNPEGKEMRQFRRKSYAGPVDFAIQMPGNEEGAASGVKARIIDMSDGGIGIQVDYPLEPGFMVTVTHGNVEKRGIVRWAIKVDDQHHRAGLAFPKGEAHGTQYPVELEDIYSEVRENLQRYVSALHIKTDKYLQALKELSYECSALQPESARIMNDLTAINDDMLDACAEFERVAALDKELILTERKAFHVKSDPILSRSLLYRNARTWPQGYQGDYKMLEYIYKNTSASEGLGHYLDRYGLSLPLAKAVRSRIMKLEGIIWQEITRRDALTVLNIACGSCRELMGLAPDIAKTKAKFTCIDSDVDALTFAMERLSHTEAAEEISFRKYNALRMFDDELNMAEFGKMDVIYSAGFFDYLDSDFLAKMLGALYRLLQNDGTLVAAFKDAGRYRHQDFHWFVDWTGFRQRTEKEFLAILDQAGIPSSSIRVERDDTGIIIFYLISKQ